MNKEIKSVLTKRFQTTMIGSLYEFEQVFGYLWGLDKEDQDLTASENRFRLLWEDTRNAILNNGNNQLRKCLADLERLLDHPPEKYIYKFYKRGHYEN
jgi:hypothetical protein